MQVRQKASLYGQDTGKYIVSRETQERRGSWYNQEIDIWIARWNREVERIYIAAPDLEGVALTRSWALKRRVSIVRLLNWS